MTKVDWPIGAAEERLASQGAIPGHWQNSNPYLNLYKINPQGAFNYHTGVDLNLNYPHWNDDFHMPIVAVADGVVVFAGVGGGSWGHIIVVESVNPRTDKPFWWRVGHIESPAVITGDTVAQAQTIAHVGNGDGYYGQSGAHLHLDISPSSILLGKPNYWPGANRQAVLDNFVDPVKFMKEQFMTDNPVDTTPFVRAWLAARPANSTILIASVPPSREPLGTIEAIETDAATLLQISGPAPTSKAYVKVAELNVRASPSAGATPIVRVLKFGDEIEVIQTVGGWSQISDGWVYASSTSTTVPQ